MQRLGKNDHKNILCRKIKTAYDKMKNQGGSGLKQVYISQGDKHVGRV